MNRPRFALIASFAASWLAASAHAEEPALPKVVPGRHSVAVVVGISTYENLDKAVHLDYARSDATTVADALRLQARFSHVFQLRDGEATREAIRDTLRKEAAQLVGPNDVFVLYFVGHGIGADLGVPSLLAYDSTQKNGPTDGLELQAFARDLQTWVGNAGTTLIVTDAIHSKQLDGIYFYGPSASEWPAMPANTMILSSSQANLAGRDGAFGSVFADAISGGADGNDDKAVTASELYTYISNALTPQGQPPEAAGNFNGNMVIATDVAGVVKRVTVEPPPVEYPPVEISAKFVWSEGASPTVQCRDEPIVACPYSCVIRSFLVGPCEISALVDGIPMKGKSVVMLPGTYDCSRKGGDLTCEGPRPTGQK